MKFPYTMAEPADGFNTMERVFLRELIINMYHVLPSSEDRFIVLAIHEMGYSQEDVSRMLGKSQVMVSTHLKKIKKYLRNHPIMANML